MRRVLFLLIFSLLLSGCSNNDIHETPLFSDRVYLSFENFEVRDYFIPETIYVIGLGDSLTQGVGDEYKREGYYGRVTLAMNDWKGVKKINSSNLAKRGRRSDQLLEQLDDPEIQKKIKKADVIYLTIGGNDIMKVVKKNLFKLESEQFYSELGKFENRLDQVFKTIRALNGDTAIFVVGLYNPFSIITDEKNEFETIIDDWNEAIEIQVVMDGKACFTPVNDLFVGNENLVYHTDFFHPNAKGYESMANRLIEKIDACGLADLTDGKLEMQR
ncbi:GDSL-type esterase/lipase family protein [Sporosarcina oncorhynchi]|uniref:GDSL-type esterase/lipase family protein n=1 Tax=Sporosarcina oncorhynchi TaxID=3056444 RepID=A0ABZ0L8Z9_9BACL|nr:GDSL-type esterase/lipase family protein [Sporosarcina sp. T2O-4]WOV88980.1 GDSL-type esterase/lipase family protein [Sporosarcina sp. T2O-4]